MDGKSKVSSSLIANFPNSESLDGTNVDGSNLLNNQVNFIEPRCRINSGQINFSILNGRIVFTKLKQAFTKALIIEFFDL